MVASAYPQTVAAQESYQSLLEFAHLLVEHLFLKEDLRETVGRRLIAFRRCMPHIAVLQHLRETRTGENAVRPWNKVQVWSRRILTLGQSQKSSSASTRSARSRLAASAPACAASIESSRKRRRSRKPRIRACTRVTTFSCGPNSAFTSATRRARKERTTFLSSAYSFHELGSELSC